MPINPLNNRFIGISLQNRGSKNRTRIDGFGDRCSTVELCPFSQLLKAVFSLTSYSISQNRMKKQAEFQNISNFSAAIIYPCLRLSLTDTGRRISLQPCQCAQRLCTGSRQGSCRNQTLSGAPRQSRCRKDRCPVRRRHR